MNAENTDSKRTRRGAGFAVPGRRMLTAGLAAALWASSASTDGAPAEPGSPAVRFAAHEALPEGGPEELAELYYAASEVPGIASLGANNRRSLLDAVTHRHKNRLADREPGAEADMRAHLDRLSRSALAVEHPMVVAQTCAQYGIGDGACEAHRGYVRRARVLEEMLASGRLTLAELETELVGAPRRSLRAAHDR